MRSLRGRWLLYALSVGTVGLLITSPVAFADQGRGHGNDHHVVRAQHTDADQDQDQDQDDQVAQADRDDQAHTARVNALVAALNNQVTALSALSLDPDTDADVDAGRIRVVSLAQLEAGLSSTEASTVTTAVNANTAALQTFLQGGSTNATAINAALTAAGVSASSVQAILARGDRLLVVTT
jgi:hypothetical protein